MGRRVHTSAAFTSHVALASIGRRLAGRCAGCCRSASLADAAVLARALAACDNTAVRRDVPSPLVMRVFTTKTLSLFVFSL